MKDYKSPDVKYEDIIFEGRNTLYGAYDIRRKYNDYALKSLAVATSVFLLFLLGPVAYEKFKPEVEIEEEVILPVDLKKLEPPPIDPKTPPPPPMPATPPPPQVTTVRFVPPEIAPDEEIQEEDPPKQEELVKVQAGAQDQEGDPNADPNIQVIENTGSGNGNSLTGEVVEEAPFTYAETMPSFPGGEAEMMAFIKKNIKYPQEALRLGEQGTVYVQLVVNPDGKITGVEPMPGRTLGYGLDKEAVRVVNMMPDWSPGKNSGRPVRVKITIPIKFKLS